MPFSKEQIFKNSLEYYFRKNLWEKPIIKLYKDSWILSLHL